MVMIFVRSVSRKSHLRVVVVELLFSWVVRQVSVDISDGKGRFVFHLGIVWLVFFD
jgi:hypothetical protein